MAESSVEFVYILWQVSRSIAPYFASISWYWIFGILEKLVQDLFKLFLPFVIVRFSPNSFV